LPIVQRSQERVASECIAVALRSHDIVTEETVMAAQEEDFTAQQNTTFREQLTMETTSGDPPVSTPQDLTGCTALMMIRTAYNAPKPVVTLSTTPTADTSIVLGGTTGTIDLFISASAMQSIYVPLTQSPAAEPGADTPPSATYVYDLILTFPSGDSECACYGTFTVSASVTHL